MFRLILGEDRLAFDSICIRFVAIVARISFGSGAYVLRNKK